MRIFLAGLAFFACLADARAFDHSHALWNGLLQKHVVLAGGGRASQVRYAAMQQDRPVLKGYLESLSGAKEEEFNAWTRPQRMAFLINAYNAFTVELILANYPVKSIKDIGGVFDNRWKRKFFSLFGRPASLDQIEHEMLRKPGAYDEPRVHFALNCASTGCPMLREEAYAAERLDRQLEEQTERFLSDRSRNRFAGGRLEVSKLFDWYQEDFAPRERFLAKYAALLAENPAGRKLVAEGRAAISFLEYDWTLNDFPSSSPR
jgi:hypothetical protein